MTRPTASARRGPAIAGVTLALVVLAGAGWYATRQPSAAGGVTVDRYGDRLQTVEAGHLPVFALPRHHA